MADERISQRPEAVLQEVTNESYLVINTPQGVTKKVKLSTFNQQGGVMAFKLVIEPAEVQTLGSVPISFTEKPGLGKAYAMIGASLFVNYLGTPYATNTSLDIKADGATQPQYRLLNALNASLVSERQLGRFIVGAADTQIVEDAALQVIVPGGDPTLGDATITIFGTFRLNER